MLSLGLLGPFRLERDDGSLAALPKKAKALLGFLALHSAQAVPRDRLCALIWDRSGTEQARQSLRQCLLIVRHALGPVASDALVADADSVVLRRCDSLSVDVHEFEALHRSTDVADLTAASMLYRDELLAGLQVASEPFNEWLRNERARLSLLSGDVLSALAAAHAESGDFEAAIVAAQRLTGLDPLRETGHRLVMEFFAASGRRSEALRQFASFTELLRQELDVAPDEATAALAEKIRCQEIANPAPAPAPAGPPPTETSSDLAVPPEIAKAAAPPDLQPASPMARAARAHSGRWAIPGARVLAWSVVTICVFSFAATALWQPFGKSAPARGNAEMADRLARMAADITWTSRESYRTARDLQQLSIDLGRSDAGALTALASMMTTAVLEGWVDKPEEETYRADLLLNEAARIDPNDRRIVRGRCQLLRAMRRSLKAIEFCVEYAKLAPDDPFPHKEIGFNKIFLGLLEDAVVEFLEAERLAPKSADRWQWQRGAGWAYLMLGRDEQAIEWLRRSAEVAPEPKRPTAFLAAAYALSGRREEAQAMLAEHLRSWPAASVTKFESMTGTLKYALKMERVIEGLRLAGMREQ